MQKQVEPGEQSGAALEEATVLERESATREILNAISSCRDDDTPIFDVVLKNAAQLCDSPTATLLLLNDAGDKLILRAIWGEPLHHFKIEEHGVPLDGVASPAEAVRESRTIHVGDMIDSDAYRANDPTRRKAVDEEGIRSHLSVPLLKDGKAIGCIDLFQREVRPFSIQKIELIESFAVQAVIAINNVQQFRELQSRLEREAATKAILQTISESREDERPVFEAILTNAIRLCDATHAMMCLVDETRGHFYVPAHIGASDEIAAVWDELSVDLATSEISTARAITDGKIFHIEDLVEVAKQTKDPNQNKLIELEGVRTYLVVPLMRDNHAIGTINLYRREVRAFTEDQTGLLEAFAAQAVIAIENVRQYRALADRTAEVEALNTSLETRVEEQVGEIERMGRLKRFLPSAVADTVVSQGNDEMLSSHRALLGVLFCDIRGFTAFCETAEPEETIEVLQTYHEEMGKLINEYGAGVDHRMGDGIMVLFNDPLPCDDPAGDAVRLALAMRARMVELCRKWKRLGHRLGFGVGISFGYATVGMVGYEGRYDYTASGTAVNLAARLCDLAEDGEILLSPRANTAIEDDIETEPKGEATLKGISAPVEVFRLAKI